MATPPNQTGNQSQGTTFAGPAQEDPGQPAPAPAPVQPGAPTSLSLKQQADMTSKALINEKKRVDSLENRLDVNDFEKERELTYLDDTGFKNYIQDQHDTTVVYRNVSDKFMGWFAGKRIGATMKYAADPEELKEYTKERSKLDDFGFVLDGKRQDFDRVKITYLTKVGNRTVEIPEVYRVRPSYDGTTNKTYVHIENIKYVPPQEAKMHNVRIEVGKAD